MLQIDFAFSSVESIRRFTSAFVAVCSATSHPFEFPSIKKHLNLDIIELLFNILRNQDKKVAFIRVDEYGALEISSEFMRKYNRMNIIFQTTGADASSLNGKIKIPNKTLYNTKREIMMNSCHKKYLWCFDYHYSICIYRQTENMLCGDVPYFLWNG